MFRHPFRSVVALLALVAGLSLASPAHAQVTVPHKEHCKGTLTDVLLPTPTHPLPSLLFAGVGQATHFGKYSVEGSNDFDDQGNVLNGEFTTTVADGSTISGVYEGTYTPLPDGTVRFDVHVLWLEGTGRLAGVTGEADTVAFLDGVFPGAAFEYFTDGTLTFPNGGQ
jgi:hypothetical protein